MSSGQPASPSSSAGFTLVELMVTMVIIGIIATFTLPMYRSMTVRAKDAGAMVEIRELEKGINAYSIDNASRFPSTLADAGLARNDPWQRPYQYRNIAYDHAAPRMGLFEPLNTDFDLFSLGPDGITGVGIDDEGSGDDVVRAADGSFLGLGSDLR